MEAGHVTLIPTVKIRLEVLRVLQTLALNADRLRASAKSGINVLMSRVHFKT